jgi:hypothetical protein
MTTTDASRNPPVARAVLLLGLLAALGLRVWEAAESSLWLDELHTLSHAAQPTLAAVLTSVRQEVHTPLFFAAVYLCGAWPEGAWLRIIPLVSSLVLVVPLWQLARDAGGRRAAIVALWLFALLPYQVHWATELRPYAWVALFSAGAVWGAFGERGPKPARLVLFFLCTLLGLYTHRIMALTVFSIGAVRLASWRRAGLVHLGWLVAAGVLAVAPFLPWLVSFAEEATADRFEYQEAVGGYTLRPQLVKEVLALPARLFVPYVGALGGWWARLAQVGAALFFGALALGLYRRVRLGASSGPTSFLAKSLAAFAAVDFLVITALSIWTWDRVPLQYYAPLAWLLPLLAAEVLAGVPGAGGRGPCAAALAGALALGVAQAGGSSTEDMRLAVATARAQGSALSGAGREPIYTALLSQPSFFEHKLPYLAYAPELGAVEPDEAGAADPGRPLVVVRRGAIELAHPAWEPMLRGRRVELVVPIDAYLSVYVLGPAGGS